jgi:hypothetical protein
LSVSTTRRTLRAETPKNHFTFAKNPLTQGACSRLRHLVPLDVLNIAAAVADEVVVPHAFGIESRGTALDGYFTH